MEALVAAAAGIVVGGAVLFGLITLFGKSKYNAGKAEAQVRFTKQVAVEEKVREIRAQQVINEPRMSPRERLRLMRKLADQRAAAVRNSKT